MPSLYTVNTDDIVQAADVNQFKKMLEGDATYTMAWLLRVAASQNFIIRLADNAGAQKFSIQDSDGVEVASINSNGDLAINTYTFSNLTLPTSASPAQTTEGQIVWDSANDRLTIGDGSSRKTFFPGGNTRPEVLRPVLPVLITIANQALTANTAYLLPIEPLTADVTITKIRLLIANSNGNIDAGVYSWDGTTMTRVVSLGSTAMPAAATVDLDIADTSLIPGTRYYLAMSADNATATFAAVNSVGGGPAMSSAFSKTASFPLPATITSLSVYASPPIMYGLVSGGIS